MNVSEQKFREEVRHISVKIQLYNPVPVQFQEITITGFSGNERVDIGHLIEMHGGTFTGQMSKHTCTHLIAANESGEKYRRAKEWGTMHIVSEKWLRKCVEMVLFFYF